VLSLLAAAPLAFAQSSAAEPRARASAIIVLRLAGGPSQLETFDPHDGTRAAAGTTSISTRAPGVRLASGYERLADQMHRVALVRSMTTPESDHERATTVALTGAPPDPTVAYPSIGAVTNHALSPRGGLPAHVALMPGLWPPRGGALGASHDALVIADPARPSAGLAPSVPLDRLDRRLEALAVVDAAFARGRPPGITGARSDTTAAARALLSSGITEVLDVSSEPAAIRASYGDGAFGRACLAARRLVERGTRCVEVTLDGWDTHVANHAAHARLARTLDPALAGLLADLAAREMLDRTLVVAGGEIGRTPELNRAEGRDHWTSGFTVLMAGGPIRGGVVVGATDPEGRRAPADPKSWADVWTTVMVAMGIDPASEAIAPSGRPIRLGRGAPIAALL
jgi:uncharacterized protein (DUF1501 family)